eukprot:TRINITY_DN73509_c0_g1_i1.p1 TRINITY_DN73509_c0_g1~~TRINITY_DN73509_c0_g1_i1.p1  ORF type:complete len:339 (-),score=55.11 TRINITY_DN73509_c0_g1_i1:74-1090(-)
MRLCALILAIANSIPALSDASPLQCNVTVASAAQLPCKLPRCRYRADGSRNVTERGLHYDESLIHKFFQEEWADYQGFLGLETAYFVQLIGVIQRELGVFGTIGEIGVAAGKSFVTLAFTRRSAEPLFVCDLFAGSGHPDVEKAGIEVEQDNAAMANLPMFMDTLQFAGIDGTAVQVHDGPSFELSDTSLFRRGLVPFRLFHVDGGHFVEAALHDLRVAACTIAPGGIIMLDDLNNGIFPGVQEAFHRFMLLERPVLRPDLVPFLHIGRLYLADRSYAEQYRARLRDRLPDEAFWSDKRYMYGEEVLVPGGLNKARAAIRKLVEAEKDFFPWPRYRRR